MSGWSGCRSERAAGPPRKRPPSEAGPAVDPMRVAGAVMPAREGRKRELADQQRRDAEIEG